MLVDDGNVDSGGDEGRGSRVLGVTSASYLVFAVKIEWILRLNTGKR